MKAILLSLVAVLSLTSAAFGQTSAVPSATLTPAENNQQQRLIVSKFTSDAKTIRIFIGDGQSNIQVTKDPATIMLNGRANVLIDTSSLKRGNVLQVRTYDSTGKKLGIFSASIPCQGDISPFTDGTPAPLSCEGVAVTGTTDPQSNQPPPPPCTAGVVAVKDSPTVSVQISCVPDRSVSVELWSGTTMVRENRQFGAIQATGEAVNFQRDMNHKFAYTIKVYDVKTGNRLIVQDGLIYKSLTFNSAPVVQFDPNLKSWNQPQPTEVKGFFGGTGKNGIEWDLKISAQVFDADINEEMDPSDSSNTIRVEIYNVTTGKKLGETYVKSGDSASFSLKHVKNEKSEQQNDDFSYGQHNSIKLKVHDAGRPNTDDGAVWSNEILVGIYG